MSEDDPRTSVENLNESVFYADPKKTIVGLRRKLKYSRRKIRKLKKERDVHLKKANSYSSYFNKRRYIALAGEVGERLKMAREHQSEILAEICSFEWTSKWLSARSIRSGLMADRVDLLKLNIIDLEKRVIRSVRSIRNEELLLQTVNSRMQSDKLELNAPTLIAALPSPLRKFLLGVLRRDMALQAEELVSLSGLIKSKKDGIQALVDELEKNKEFWESSTDLSLACTTLPDLLAFIEDVEIRTEAELIELNPGKFCDLPKFNGGKHFSAQHLFEDSETLSLKTQALLNKAEAIVVAKERQAALIAEKHIAEGYNRIENRIMLALDKLIVFDSKLKAVVAAAESTGELDTDILFREMESAFSERLQLGDYFVNRSVTGHRALELLEKFFQVERELTLHLILSVKIAFPVVRRNTESVLERLSKCKATTPGATAGSTGAKADPSYKRLAEEQMMEILMLSERVVSEKIYLQESFRSRQEKAPASSSSSSSSSSSGQSDMTEELKAAFNDLEVVASSLIMYRGKMLDAMFKAGFIESVYLYDRLLIRRSLQLSPQDPEQINISRCIKQLELPLESMIKVLKKFSKDYLDESVHQSEGDESSQSAVASVLEIPLLQRHSARLVLTELISAEKNLRALGEKMVQPELERVKLWEWRVLVALHVGDNDLAEQAKLRKEAHEKFLSMLNSVYSAKRYKIPPLPSAFVEARQVVEEIETKCGLHPDRAVQEQSMVFVLSLFDRMLILLEHLKEFLDEKKDALG